MTQAKVSFLTAAYKSGKFGNCKGAALRQIRESQAKKQRGTYRKAGMTIGATSAATGDTGLLSAESTRVLTHTSDTITAGNRVSVIR